MKLSRFLLFFVCAALSATLGASETVQDEPIPDFGPEGPVGYKPRQEVAPATTSPGRPNQAQGTGRYLAFIRTALRQLDLDAGQQQAIRAVFENFSEEGEKLRSEMTRVRDTLQAAQMAEGNESAVKYARQAMAELSREGQALQGKLRQSISEVLSEEQLTQFNQIQEARRKQAVRRGKP